MFHRASLSTRERTSVTMASVINEGDIVKFDRGAYFHWGIYIGRGEIVHVASAGTDRELSVLETSSRRGEKAIIMRSGIASCANGSKCWSENYLDGIFTPRTVEEIVSFALEKARLKEWDYNVVSRNCQHFAVWCRYGMKDLGEQAKAYFKKWFYRSSSS